MNGPTDSKIDQCPKCGGTTGYWLLARIELGGEWGEEAESKAIGRDWSPKTVICEDCGARVSRRIARGG